LLGNLRKSTGVGQLSPAAWKNRIDMLSVLQPATGNVVLGSRIFFLVCRTLRGGSDQLSRSPCRVWQEAASCGSLLVFGGEAEASTL